MLLSEHSFILRSSKLFSSLFFTFWTSRSKNDLCNLHRNILEYSITHSNTLCIWFINTHFNHLLCNDLTIFTFNWWLYFTCIYSISFSQQYWLRNRDFFRDVLWLPTVCQDISRNRKTIVYSMSYANKVLRLMQGGCKIDLFWNFFFDNFNNSKKKLTFP